MVLLSVQEEERGGRIREGIDAEEMPLSACSANRGRSISGHDRVNEAPLAHKGRGSKPIQQPIFST